MSARAVCAGRSNRSGFTLIELVVVLLVLSAMAAVTLPAFLDPAQDDDMTVATRRIEALFRLARDSAARGGKRVTVVIDSASSRVWLDVAGAPAATEVGIPDATSLGAGRLAPRATGPAGADLELPRGVQLLLSTARASFVFAPTGMTFADSLWLGSSLGARLITIHPWTGDVIVH